MSVREALKETFPIGTIANLSKPVSVDWYAGSSSSDFGEVTSPYVLFYLKKIKMLVECIEGTDFKVREHFQQAMSALDHLGLDETELATLFGTTATAVNRWFNGHSAPTIMMRPFVITTALELLRRNGFLLGGKRYDVITGRPITH